MRYRHDKSQADSYSKEALERIKQEKLSPSPEIYELWYVYYAKLDPDVTRALDIKVVSNQKIDDEYCRVAHKKFLANAIEAEKVRSVGSVLSSTVRDLLALIHNIKNSTKNYNMSLEQAARQLEDAESEEEIAMLMKVIVAETGKILEENHDLEERLSSSTNAIQTLQQDIDLIKREATTDGLTGLMNRKAFDEELDDAVKRSNSDDEKFSLLMIDIDHFKAFNDNYGHQVGDQVLRLVARTLAECIKGKDVSARYGGEEFAIILPETELKYGMVVAENLRRAVATKDVVNRNTGEKLGRITMSVGVAEHQKGEAPEDFLDRADAALYTAKHNGRNQVAAAPNAGASTTKAKKKHAGESVI